MKPLLVALSILSVAVLALLAAVVPWTVITTVFAVLTIAFATIGTVAAGTFIALYSQPPFHWRTYEAGRHLMRFTGGIFVILAWSLVAFVLRQAYPDPDPEWLDNTILVGRVFIFGFVAVMMVGRLKILMKARHEPTPEGDSRSTATNNERGNN